jgi:hypothetical protein
MAIGPIDAVMGGSRSGATGIRLPVEASVPAEAAPAPAGEALRA